MTKGEKAINVSLNLRWLPDFIDQKQLSRIELIRYNFQPTFHDKLAQAPGKYTFFIDDSGQFWQGLGSLEIKNSKAESISTILSSTSESFIKTNSKINIPLKTVRGNDLSQGNYKLKINFETDNASNVKLSIIENQQIKSEIDFKATNPSVISIDAKGEELILEIDPLGSEVKIYSLEIIPS